MDQRIGSIRGEAEGRGLTMGNIVFHALGAQFFIGPDHQTQTALEGDPQIPDDAQAVKRGNSRSLVVDHTASVHVPVPDDHGEGIRRPAFACGDHVQMCQHTDGFFAVPVTDHTGIIVYVIGLQAHALCDFQEAVQGLCRSLTEGHSFFYRTVSGTVNSDHCCQIIQHLLPMGFKRTANFFDHLSRLCIFLPNYNTGKETIEIIKIFEFY